MFRERERERERERKRERDNVRERGSSVLLSLCLLIAQIGMASFAWWGGGFWKFCVSHRGSFLSLPMGRESKYRDEIAKPTRLGALT